MPAGAEGKPSVPQPPSLNPSSASQPIPAWRVRWAYRLAMPAPRSVHAALSLRSRLSMVQVAGSRPPAAPRCRPGLLQEMRIVEVPVYDFTTHRRSPETRRVPPADVVRAPGTQHTQHARLSALQVPTCFQLSEVQRHL